MWTRLPLVLLLVVLAACEAETESPTPLDTAAEEPAPLASAPEVDVAGTIAALQGGIMEVPLSAARDNINGWIARLDGAEFEEASGIADNLRLLHTELEGDDLDGLEIGQILSRLGEQTAAAAMGAGDARDSLAELAALLSDAGRTLGGLETAGFGQDEEL